MVKLSDLKHLWYSDEVNVFLRTTTSDVESGDNLHYYYKYIYIF